MKKTSCLIDFQFLPLSLVVLCVLFMPMLVSAGTFYNCHDKGGNDTLSNIPIEGQTCVQKQTYEETTAVPKENNKTASPDDKITKIIIRKNQILVPVTLINDNKEVTVNLLMDTGASGTTINTETADRLYISLYKAKKTKAQVVGGSIIEASIVTMDILKIGPHTIHNKNIVIVPHDGPAVKFDGLLGLDVLGSLSYKIDFARQVIIWE